MNIIDIECMANAMIALTDRNQVFVWGKRMGVYPTSMKALTRAEAERVGIQFH